MTKPKSVEALKKQEDEVQAQKAKLVRLTEQLECPPELQSVAKDEWRRVVGELIVLGILSKFDRVPLAMYCAAYALWLECCEALQTYGAVMKSPSGYPVQSPYLSIRNRQEDLMLRIASEFGFTPASRLRKLPFGISKKMVIVSEADDSDLGLRPLTF